MSKILFHLVHRDVHTADNDLPFDETVTYVKDHLERGLSFEVPDANDDRQMIVIPAASVYYVKVRDTSE